MDPAVTTPSIMKIDGNPLQEAVPLLGNSSLFFRQSSDIAHLPRLTMTKPRASSWTVAVFETRNFSATLSPPNPGTPFADEILCGFHCERLILHRNNKNVKSRKQIRETRGAGTLEKRSSSFPYPQEKTGNAARFLHPKQKYFSIRRK